MYKVEAEDITILHCGDIGMLPNENLYEEISSVDILMVPVGGHYTIDAKQAVTLVHKIDPYLVIPMHYNHEKLNQDTFGKLTSLDTFLKEMGVEKPAPVEKLTVKKDDLEEEMKVIVMNF